MLWKMLYNKCIFRLSLVLYSANFSFTVLNTFYGVYLSKIKIILTKPLLPPSSYRLQPQLTVSGLSKYEYHGIGQAIMTS